MSYVYNLADNQFRTNIFYKSEAWTKPKGITMISITAIGAGGGGGGGTTNALAAARGGGGGGGSGAITRLTIPEMFIADTLMVNIGIGGAGGVSGSGAGVKGGDTYVDMSVAGNGRIYTFVVVASGGTGANGSTAGAGGVSANVQDAIYATLGVWTATAGQSGLNGNNTTGSNILYGNTIGLPITAGAPGGGMVGGSTTATSGGTILGNGFVPTNSGGTGNTIFSGGTNGTFSIKPFYSLGGSGGGGGGTTPISGGDGGNGGPGCGGGGGGSGTSPTGAGGTGGRGGDGLVIIECW
jgi:hypothetical protein